MTNNNLKIITSTILFCALALGLACSVPPNTNQNSNRGNSNAASGAPDTAAVESDCSGNNSAIRRAKVMNGVETNIKGGKLKDQYGKNFFRFDVVILPNDKLAINVNGTIEGDGSLEDLGKALKPYVKGSCVQKVTLAGAAQTLTASQSFVWLGCEAPNIPCPNGECAPACPMASPGPASNTNANTGNSNRN